MTTVLPRIGDDLVLAVGQEARVAARVVGVGDGTLRLDLGEPLSLLPSAVVRSPLFVEFVNDEGFSRLHGRAEGAVVAAAQSAHGRLLFAHAGRPQLLRRGSARAPLNVPLSLTPLDGRPGAGWPATAVHVSTDGVLARGLPASVRLGAAFTFELALPGEERPVTGRCVVEHVDVHGHASVAFRAVDEEGRAVLRRAVFARKMEA